MLERIHVSGLKSFGGTESVGVAPITLVFGPNSAGKSTLIQALMLLKQSIESQGQEAPDLVVRGPIVDLGSYPALIHGHELSRQLELGLSFRLRGDAPDPQAAPPRVEGPRHLEFHYAWDAAARSARLQRSRVGFEGFDGWFDRASAEEASRLISGLRTTREGFVVRDDNSRLQLIRLLRRASLKPPFGDGSSTLGHLATSVLDRLQGELEAGAIPWFEGSGLLPDRLLRMEGVEQPASGGDQREPRSALQSWLLNLMGERVLPFARWIEASLEQVLGGISLELGEAMLRTHYLGPLRRAPERFQALTGVRRDDVGTDGEHFVEILARRDALRSDANRWMERLGTGYSIHTERLRADDPAGTMGDVVSLALRDLNSGVRVSPRDVGFGISQLLPIIVQSLLAKFSTLCIEQPEIHLHPRLQAELGDLFIIETHSEHLMLRLMRRIREGRIASDWVRVLYVEPAHGGGATVRELAIDDDGTFIDEWPSGFFDERLDEVLG